MSLEGDAIKYAPSIREAIRTIANRSIKGLDGAVLGTKKTVGYVSNIHTEGELAGTIDVQEFNFDLEEQSKKEGLHEGVRLSAVQDNGEGYLIVPMLYSEVVIVQNPTDGEEYVLMYSHAQRIQLHTHCVIDEESPAEISIGVTEVEAFVESDEDGIEKDYNELEPTKNKTNTKYTATSIQTQVASPDDEEGFIETTNATSKTITVKDTKITIDGENIVIETSSSVSFKVGGTTITEKDGAVEIKTNSAKIESTSCEITGGTLRINGTAAPTGSGPFNAIPVCPFSGAPHCGTTVSGT